MNEGVQLGFAQLSQNPQNNENRNPISRDAHPPGIAQYLPVLRNVAGSGGESRDTGFEGWIVVAPFGIWLL